MAFLFAPKNKIAPDTKIRVTTSLNGAPIPLVFGQTRISGNLVWYGDFVASHASSSGKGGGSKSGGSYTYSAAVIIGLAQGPLNITKVWDGSTVKALSDYNLQAFTGDPATVQNVWGYLTSRHGDQALAYEGLSYVAAGPMNLGGSSSLPNLTYEVINTSYSNAISGQPDALPGQVMTALLTDPYFGLPYTTPYLGDLSGYAAYCQALGLVISPSYTSQRAAHEVLKELLEATNSEAIFSSGKLTIVPYGDQPVSGNGASWTPANYSHGVMSPIYSLGDTDILISNASDDAITIKRKRASDAKNVVRTEYIDRGNSYNAAITESKDEGVIETSGLVLADTKTWHFYCTAAPAQMATELRLSREAIRNTYEFTIGPEYVLLDPMDVIEITNSSLGMVNQAIRITEITEGQDGELKITAEEVLDGTGNSPVYGRQASSGYQANWNIPAPSVNTPILLAAPPEVAQGLELWVAASGPAVASGTFGAWGGADVWGSSDGSSYALLGTIEAGSTTGTLTAGISAADTTLSVDLSTSGGTLVGYSVDDAKLGRSLCYIYDSTSKTGEFIAFQGASLSAGADQYRLSGVVRGLYGTTPIAHGAGALFARLDGHQLKISYTKAQIGTQLYLKFRSFNAWSSGEQDLATATEYKLTIPAPAAPPQVTGFAISQSGNVVMFRWDDLSSDWALEGYDIYFQPVGGGTQTFLTEAHRGTEMTNASVPPGTWVFGIMGRDIFGQTGPVTTETFTVANNNGTLATVNQTAPLFSGTVNGLLQHYTGGLIPDSAKAASAHSNAELFEQFVPYPASVATLTLATIDTNIAGASIVWANIQALAGRGRARSRVDFKLSADGGPFQTWTGGGATARYFAGQFSLDPSAPSILTGFSMTIAAPIRTQTMSTIAVSAIGTTITFDPPFRNAPVVQVTPSNSGVTGGAASSVTNTTAVIELFNGATLTSGTANLTITGA